MATQGQISITNTNLSGGSYNFEIYVRECGSGSWGSPIDTIPYSGFPYFFNVEQVLSGSVDCFEYLVEEPTTLAQCTGQVYITTPTPTPTVTRTATPTITPSTSQPISSGVSVNVYSTFSSGSLLANYTVVRDRVTTGSTYYEFTNTLKTTGGTDIVINALVEIPFGATSGETISKLPFKSFSDIEKGYSNISDFNTSAVEDIVVNRYAEVTFQGVVIPNVQYIFQDCCGILPNLEVVVPLTATQFNSQNPWVLQNRVISYLGNCYRPLEPGGTGTLYFASPDASSCSASICPACQPIPSLTPTRTVTPTRTPTTTATPTTTPTNTPSVTPPCSDCESDFIDCEEVMGCYSYPVGVTPTPTATVSPTPTITATITPTITQTPSITPTNLECLDPDAEGYVFDYPQE
jgi:hypothetical protein